MDQHGSDGLALRIQYTNVFHRLLDVIVIKLKKNLFIDAKAANTSKLRLKFR